MIFALHLQYQSLTSNHLLFDAATTVTEATVAHITSSQQERGKDERGCQAIL
jgi:hypothetical protein